jgi:hypothetical protein
MDLHTGSKDVRFGKAFSEPSSVDLAGLFTYDENGERQDAAPPQEVSASRKPQFQLLCRFARETRAASQTERMLHLRTKLLIDIYNRAVT